jgi:ATP-dependent helicase/nuclease subunit B
VERERKATGPAGRYAGQLSARVLDEVRRAYDQEHQFSANELDTYVRCPFRFFAKWLLDLARVEEPEEEMTPLEKGRALHAIFREFYAEWQNDHGSARLTEDDRDEALARLAAIARREFASHPYRGLVWEKFVERLLKPVSPTQRALRGLFDTFVAAEIHSMRPETACTPQRFEISFGRRPAADVLDAASDDRPVPLVVAGRRILLRGIIDRIDVNEDDQTFCILDYKSGSIIPSVQDMVAGVSLQLPIYMLATDMLLGRDYRFAAAGYFQTKDANNCGRKNFLADRELAPRAIERRWQGKGVFERAELDEFLEHERAIIGDAVVGIESGNFEVTTLGAVKARCASCDFIHICRYPGATVATFQDRT